MTKQNKGKLNKRVEEILNKQIEAEARSSQLYLAMASWAESSGINGTADFLYLHSDEERQHMLKLVRFVNERGGRAIIPSINLPQQDFASLADVFSLLLEHELKVTDMINEIVHVCLEEKDYSTHNFMQWYVAEQLEEEALARNILDKLKMIGNDKAGLYLFDRDLETIQNANPSGTAI
jgi:ferritin